MSETTLSEVSGVARREPTPPDTVSLTDPVPPEERQYLVRWDRDPKDGEVKWFPVRARGPDEAAVKFAVEVDEGNPRPPIVRTAVVCVAGEVDDTLVQIRALASITYETRVPQ